MVDMRESGPSSKLIQLNRLNFVIKIWIWEGSVELEYCVDKGAAAYIIIHELHLHVAEIMTLATP